MEKELKIETKEKEPEISYHFFYFTHATEKDCEKLEQAFHKPDIDVYVPEAYGWSDIGLVILNNVSRGKITAEQAARMFKVSRGSSRFKELQIIQGSKKPILLVDVPEEHKLIEESDKSKALDRESFDLFRAGEFQPALEKIRRAVETFSDYHLKREKLIKENLKEKIEELAKFRPELKGKEKIKALVALGGGHTGVYHDFEKEKASVSWQFASLPRVFSSFEQAIRILRFLKNKEVPDELLARVFVESGLYYDLRKVTDDTTKLLIFERKIFSKLGLKDIEKISKELGEDSNKTIADCLEERNIKIPKTEEEMDKMLGIKK